MCFSRSSPQSHTGHTTTQSTLRFNMTRRTHELCKDHYYLCEPTSANVINGFCDHGVCCVTVGVELCACQRGFGGERCDYHLLPSTSTMQQFARAMSAMSIIAVLIVVLLIAILVFFYLRAKRARIIETLKTAHELQANMLQAAPVVQPGFSWREVSVKRVKSVTRTATDKRPLSLSASDITALEFDPKATTFIPTATTAGGPGVHGVSLPEGPGGPRGPGSPTSPARDYTQLI